MDYLLPITGRTGVELWTGGWMAYVSERSEATVLSSIYLYFVELATPSMRLKSDAVSKHSSTAVVRVRFPMIYYIFMTIHTMMTTRLYYLFTTMHTMLTTRLYHPRTEASRVMSRMPLEHVKSNQDTKTNFNKLPFADV